MKFKSHLALFALLLPVLAVAVVPVPGNAPVTVTTTAIRGAVPAASARIVKDFIAPAEKGSGYDTGALHIVYSDKTEVVETLPPKIKSPPGDFLGNELGFEQVAVAEDARTIGWLGDYETDFTSYSIPEVLSIYGSGKTVLHLKQGQLVWYWEFQQGGKQAVAAWGASHGPVVLDYQLYEVATGKLLGEAFGDDQSQSLADGAPDWAKAAEAACGQHCTGPDN